MTGYHNIIKNPSFDGVPDKIVDNKLCNDWRIKFRGPSANTEYTIVPRQELDEKSVVINIDKMDSWFRLMQELPKEALNAKKFMFSFSHSAEDNNPKYNKIDSIFILEEDAKGHGVIYEAILGKIVSSPAMHVSDAVFSLNEINPERKYYITIQFASPSSIEIWDLQLTPITRFGLRPDSKRKIDKHIETATTKYSHQIAPYKQYQQANYKFLDKLNGELPSRGKKDLMGWMTDMLSLAVKMESYATASGLVEYIRAAFSEESDQKWLTVAPHIIDTYIALGEEQKMSDFLMENIDLVFRDDRLFTTFSKLLCDQGSTNADMYKLPSGKPNIYALSKLDTLQKQSFTDLLFTVAPWLDKNPELYLLMANNYVSTNPALYQKMLNKYLRTMGVSTAETLLNTSDNILGTIQFSTPAPIHSTIKVSVIIAGYNCAETVQYAIRSILNQSYQNIEVLFCDDNSNDKTLETITSHFSDPRLKVFSSKGNQGPYNIRNNMIRIAEGDFITFHDSDDLALPCRIEMQLEEMLANDTLMSLGRWIRIHPDGKFIFFRDHACLRMCVNSIMFRKEVFDVIGPYRSALCGADSEFYEQGRAVFGDNNVSHITKPLVLGLWSDGSLTKTNGIEALDNGYRAPKRRAYAETASRQRILGTDVVPHDYLDKILKEHKVFRKNMGVVAA